MSFGGILATALAGGAGVIGKQAGDDIEAQRKADMLKQQADIEFQTQQRLAEMRQRLDRDQTLWKTQGEGGTATLDFNRRDIEQRNDLAIKGEVAKATNPELAAAKDTQAEAELQREIRKIQATAKPEAEKAAAIAEARARAEAKYRKADPTIAGKMADMEKALGRPLNEQERLAALGLAPKERNPELDTVTIEEISGDPMGQHTKTTRKEVRRPGNGSEQPKPSQQQAHAEAEAAIKQGASREAVNAKLAKLGYEPLGGAKSGGMVPGAARAATAKPEPEYRPASDGSGRMVDVTTGRTLTPEQSAILAKIQRGEPTTPRERALLND